MSRLLPGVLAVAGGVLLAVLLFVPFVFRSYRRRGELGFGPMLVAFGLGGIREWNSGCSSHGALTGQPATEDQNSRAGPTDSGPTSMNACSQPITTPR